MTPEDKELLLKDLSARLPYGVEVKFTINKNIERNNDLIYVTDGEYSYISNKRTILTYDNIKYVYNDWFDDVKPYLRPMSSMTEEEAKEIGTLHCLKNILSVKITDEYIDVVIDDGFSSTETITLWYDELISSIECFDWLNKNHFDYRGLISKKLAIAVTKENNPYEN